MSLSAATGSSCVGLPWRLIVAATSLPQVSYHPVLLRRGALVLPELLDEEAGIVVAAVLGDLGHGHVAAGQKVAGALHPVVVHVVDGRAVDDGLEEAAEVLRRHARQPRQRLQRDAVQVYQVTVVYQNKDSNEKTYITGAKGAN